MNNSSFWREHAGLLIPEDVRPWTADELRLVGGGEDPYTYDPWAGFLRTGNTRGTVWAGDELVGEIVSFSGKVLIERRVVIPRPRVKRKRRKRRLPQMPITYSGTFKVSSIDDGFQRAFYEWLMGPSLRQRYDDTVAANAALVWAALHTPMGGRRFARMWWRNLWAAIRWEFKRSWWEATHL